MPNPGTSNGTARKPKASKPQTRDIPLTYGTVKVDAGRLQVPVSIARNKCTLGDADEFLCGRRLDATLVIYDGNPDQRVLPGLDPPQTELEGVFDCRGFTVSPTAITTVLAFEVATLDLRMLRLFPNHQGLLRIEHAELIPATDPSPKPPLQQPELKDEVA